MEPGLRTSVPDDLSRVSPISLSCAKVRSRGLADAAAPELLAEVNPSLFFDIHPAPGKPSGHITFQLFADKVPKTAENFPVLRTREKGLGYKVFCFHRNTLGFMCQGGDFTRHSDTRGKSIDREKADDENTILKHMGPGILSTANAGPNTNSSQFFLSTAKTEWLEGVHVVKDGPDAVRAMEPYRFRNGKTSKVTVADCGHL